MISKLFGPDIRKDLITIVKRGLVVGVFFILGLLILYYIFDIYGSEVNTYFLILMLPPYFIYTAVNVGGFFQLIFSKSSPITIIGAPIAIGLAMLLHGFFISLMTFEWKNKKVRRTLRLILILYFFFGILVNLGLYLFLVLATS
ncbi:hypothetical protein ACFLRF_04825 [Candidatus Altiarchaeota archaeon]